jgi:hypothetical protein
MKPASLLLNVILLALGVVIGRFALHQGAQEPTMSEPVIFKDEPVTASEASDTKETKLAARPSLGDTLNLPRSADRRRIIFGVLANLTAENWEPVYKAFLEQKCQGKLNADEWELLLATLGDVAGPTVMPRLIQDLHIGMDGASPTDVHSVLRAWAARNPSQAEGWANTITQKKFRDGLWSGYFGGLAEANLKMAREKFAKVEPKDRHYSFYDVAPRVFQQEGVAGGIVWLAETLQRTNLTSSAEVGYAGLVFGAVADRMMDANAARGECETTMNWLLQHAGKPYASSTKWDKAAQLLVSQAPEKAVNYFQKIYAEHRQEASMGLARSVDVWAIKDKSATEQWLTSQQSQPFYDMVVVQFIRKLQTTAPEETGKWIETVTDSKLRSSLQVRPQP